MPPSAIFHSVFQLEPHYAIKTKRNLIRMSHQPIRYFILETYLLIETI